MCNPWSEYVCILLHLQYLVFIFAPLQTLHVSTDTPSIDCLLVLQYLLSILGILLIATKTVQATITTKLLLSAYHVKQ